MNATGQLEAPRRRPARAAPRVALAAALVVVACGGSPTEPGPDPNPGPDPAPGPGLLLADGEVVVPGAFDRGDPGDHEPVVLSARLRPDLGATAGLRIVVTLRDLSRPGIVCTSPEPEDGCVTVDWSADPSEPRTPRNGLFDNRLRLELASGARSYFFSRTLRLNNVPDVIDPNQEHTAVSGSPTSWSAILPTDLVGRSELEVRLVMTNWQPPAVRVGFRVELVP